MRLLIPKVYNQITRLSSTYFKFITQLSDVESDKSTAMPNRSKTSQRGRTNRKKRTEQKDARISCGTAPDSKPPLSGRGRKKQSRPYRNDSAACIVYLSDVRAVDQSASFFSSPTPSSTSYSLSPAMMCSLPEPTVERTVSEVSTSSFHSASIS